ncbi:MAG: OB-fold nucleic acid binding domain-containing protein, partial [Firmicutes bacterium]|nr:OB-fold nucleic acid binding domain-containing protein [Bacillota bacterium]
MENNNEQICAKEQERVRLEKFKALQKKGQDPFLITKYNVTKRSVEVVKEYDALVKAAQEISVAGRIMLKRVMGKASFFHIQDEDGRIQIYISQNDIGEKAYEEFKDLDLGDIVGVRGKAFTTKTGEISIHANSYVLLAKSLKPLPDKHAGLTDVEQKYRERYVDLIMNEETRETFKTRTAVIKAIREFYDAQGFMEVDTPALATLMSGADASPFKTRHNALGMDM